MEKEIQGLEKKIAEYNSKIETVKKRLGKKTGGGQNYYNKYIKYKKKYLILQKLARERGWEL